MDLVARAAIGFFAILLVTRVVGRRELSRMEPFDLILLIVTGDLMQQGITQSDYSLTGAAQQPAFRALSQAVAAARRRHPNDRRRPRGGCDFARAPACGAARCGA